jgi:hypothetical protein
MLHSILPRYKYFTGHFVFKCLSQIKRHSTTTKMTGKNYIRKYVVSLSDKAKDCRTLVAKHYYQQSIYNNQKQSESYECLWEENTCVHAHTHTQGTISTVWKVNSAFRCAEVCVKIWKVCSKGSNEGKRQTELCRSLQSFSGWLIWGTTFLYTPTIVKMHLQHPMC